MQKTRVKKRKNDLKKRVKSFTLKLVLNEEGAILMDDGG
jgi:hypothetical protein